MLLLLLLRGLALLLGTALVVLVVLVVVIVRGSLGLCCLRDLGQLQLPLLLLPARRLHSHQQQQQQQRVVRQLNQSLTQQEGMSHQRESRRVTQ